MPTYAYKCTGCDHRYETRESFDSPARQACPVCGEIAKRVIFPPPIVFKGSGFYVTDSRKGSSATVTSEAGSSTSGSSDSGGNGETSGDSKSESKGDSTAESNSKAAKTGSDDS